MWSAGSPLDISCAQLGGLGKRDVAGQPAQLPAAGAAGEVGLPGAGLLGLALKLGSRVFKENEEEKIKKLGKLYKSTLDSVRDVIF